MIGTPTQAQKPAYFPYPLDEELSRDEHVFRFDLSRGDMLWVANRVIAHGRDTYRADPDHPRWMLRQWVRSRESTARPE